MVKSGEKLTTRGATIREWLPKLIKQVNLFGFQLNMDAIRKESAAIASPNGILMLLRSVQEKLASQGVTGIMLILDEINGITKNPIFAHIIKDMIDTNASQSIPVPMLLMMCGAQDRRVDMIRHHPPVGRIFDVVPIDPMESKDTKDFFRRAFNSVDVALAADAVDEMVYYSGGLPKIMHEIGDAAYFIDDDSRISREDALGAVEQAAVEVGRKYVEPQVVDALKSRAYHSILDKLAKLDKPEFTRDELTSGLTEDEAKKLDNFLKRLKTLKVIRPGEAQGEYIFNVMMFQVYLTMRSYRPGKD